MESNNRLPHIVKIVYIDDNLDSFLNRYLVDLKNRQFIIDNEKGDMLVSLEYSELLFDASQDLTDLLKEQKIDEADIVIVDYKLYESMPESTQLTGSKLRTIFQSIFPFKKLFVLTQHDHVEGKYTIKKYPTDANSDNRNRAEEYYNEHLLNELEQAIRLLVVNRSESLNINSIPGLDLTTAERIRSSLFGGLVYNALSDAKIDELIDSFRVLKKDILNAYDK